MKLAIVGSREWGHPEMVRSFIQALPKDTIVISGHARGVDRYAETFAREAGLEVISFPADWSLGPKAGLLRNTQIVNTCDKLVAFWDGKSKGTKDSIRKAMEQNKLERVIVSGVSDLDLGVALGLPRTGASGRIPPGS